MTERPDPIQGTLRKHTLHIPAEIRTCSGIFVFGKRIKSLIFSTDLAIIKNNDADAVIAVYPFTPQPGILNGILTTADIPVFAGIGGGLTQGKRVLMMGMSAEMQGAMGVVVNAPTSNAVIRELAAGLEIPVVVTIASEQDDFESRIQAGAGILNISAAGRTPAVIRAIRQNHPRFPIIATGGPTTETIVETIAAGANAITWTPPSTGELFAEIMKTYRA